MSQPYIKKNYEMTMIAKIFKTRELGLFPRGSSLFPKEQSCP